MQNGAVVYLLRKTCLTLKEIGKLTPKQFIEIIKEVQRQESQEEYSENYRTASLMAAVYNTIPRRNRKVFTPRDFLPEREQNIDGEVQGKLEKMASEVDIIMPKYKER